jgi:hypothetical protein
MLCEIANQCLVALLLPTPTRFDRSGPRSPVQGTSTKGTTESSIETRNEENSGAIFIGFV